MAIQHRRGAYDNFDPTKMTPAEIAIVVSNDPNVSDGKAAYIAFAAGVVKRLLTRNDIDEELADAVAEAIAEAEEAAASIVLTQEQINALIALLT